jgi:hypothetical protein
MGRRFPPLQLAVAVIIGIMTAIIILIFYHGVWLLIASTNAVSDYFAAK